jgi:hypothetical protein
LDHGFFGAGQPLNPDQGRFAITFEHDLPNSLDESARSVFVRAWNGASPAASFAFGESSLYVVTNAVGEVHDFGAWTVNKPFNYPGPNAPDFNNDGVPDGFDVINGRDPAVGPGALPAALSVVNTFGTFGSGDDQFNLPSRVQVIGDQLLVLDTRNNRVKVHDRHTGAYLGALGPGGIAQFSQPYGLAVDTVNSRVHVADSGNNRVRSYAYVPATRTFTHLNTFGTFGSANGQMKNPRGISVDASGNISVADTDNNRVQVFTSAGAFVRSTGVFGAGNAQFKGPQALFVDINGIAHVADTDNHRMQALNGSGAYLWKFGAVGVATNQFNRPGDVRLGYAERYFVADTSNHRLSVTSKLRNRSAVVGHNGVLPGEFSFRRASTPCSKRTSCMLRTHSTTASRCWP